MLGLDQESDFYCATQDARQSSLDGTQEAVFQPLLGIRVLRPHDEKTVLVGDGERPLEPGIIGGPSHLELQLALGGLPDSMGVHALDDPFWTDKRGLPPDFGRGLLWIPQHPEDAERIRLSLTTFGGTNVPVRF